MIPSDSPFIFSKWKIKLKKVKVEVKGYLETRWQSSETNGKLLAPHSTSFLSQICLSEIK